jgi:hypothetical protein
MTDPQQRTRDISLPPTSKPHKTRGLMLRQASAGEEMELEDLRLKLSGEEEESRLRIDYTRLKDLLACKRWQEADKETRDILCELMGKRAGTYLYNKDIEKLPCKDLKAIDFYGSNRVKVALVFASKNKFMKKLGKNTIYFASKSVGRYMMRKAILIYGLICDRLWDIYLLGLGSGVYLGGNTQVF